MTLSYSAHLSAEILHLFIYVVTFYPWLFNILILVILLSYLFEPLWDISHMTQSPTWLNALVHPECNCYSKFNIYNSRAFIYEFTTHVPPNHLAHLLTSLIYLLLFKLFLLHWDYFLWICLLISLILSSAVSNILFNVSTKFLIFITWFFYF